MGYCECVQKIENEYWVKDALMEDAIDNFILSVDDINDLSDASSSTGSDSESELATPLPIDD